MTATIDIPPGLDIPAGATLIGPQVGGQKRFLASDADFAIYGGKAFTGKTYALLLDQVYDCLNPGFRAVIFRSTMKQVKGPGGLWETSLQLYPKMRAIPHVSDHLFRFPSGSIVQFGYMENDADLANWDGQQMASIGWDQLEQFDERHVLYLFSRMRTMSGARLRMRGTCNPRRDCFLRTFLGWWIDDATGLAIAERSGVKRWVARVNDSFQWSSDRFDLIERFGDLGLEVDDPKQVPTKSVTFIAGHLSDNPIGMSQNPGYVASLGMLSRVDRMRLLGGDWNATESTSKLFNRDDFEVIDHCPRLVKRARAWDRAATPDTAENAKEASHTAGGEIGVTANGMFVIPDMQRFQKSGAEVKKRIRNRATQDGQEVIVGIFQDPGAPGKAEVDDMKRYLVPYRVKVLSTTPPSKNPDIDDASNAKIRYAKPWARESEEGNVKIVRGDWNEPFLSEVDMFDGVTKPNDQVDSISGGFHILTSAREMRVLA
jgi:phage terminase large subunit-like protein